MLHNLVSSFIFVVIVVAEEAWWHKNKAFISFQISQEKSMSIGYGLPNISCPKVIFVHQSWRQTSFAHKDVSKSCRPIHGRISFQIWVVKQHSNRGCKADFLNLIAKGQLPHFVRTLESIRLTFKIYFAKLTIQRALI
jgi:hypothetical protein